MKKRVLLIVGVILVLCLVGTSVYLVRVMNYQKTVKNISYSHINITQISDGTYIGECNVEFISAKVAVTVENGAITEIEILEHKNDRGTSAEKIINDIIQQQAIDVDAVTGATNSSKVIKKAIENALIQ